MKKIFLAFLILISVRGISQVSISQLPTYTGSPVGTFVPLVQGGSTKKIDGSKLGQVSDSTKIPYLAKNNNFTGNDTFPSIVWASNGSDTLATQSYVRSVGGGGGGSNIDTTRIPFLAKNNTFTGDNSFTTLELNSLTASSVINLGGYGINSFSNDTSLSSSPQYSLPTQNAVKSYVTNHTPNLSGYQVTSNISNDTSFAANSATLYPSQQATKSYVTNHVPSLSGYQVTSNLSNDSSFAANSSTLYPTQNAVTGYVSNHSQLKSNLSNDGTFSANSPTLYPSQQAAKTYTDGLVVGLLNDRGSYNASSNVYPSTGGSGTAGAILKGDIWYINTAGTLGGTSVSVGASVRALANSPAQTSSNWDILNVGLGYVPENVANKSTSVSSDSSSSTKYPTVQSVGRYAQSISNLSNNATTDSASTTKYPSVQAITRFVKANIPSYTDTSITLSGTSTTSAKYTFVHPSVSGNLLYTNPNPSIGETDYIYNITGAYSGNNYFTLRANSGTYFYATASSGSYTNSIRIDSGRQVRIQYVGSGEWLYTVQNQGLNPQDVNNLATSITPSDSASNTLYPSVNAVKNYVQANIPSKVYYEFRARLYQSGTTAPAIQKVFVDDIDTFSVNSVSFQYISTGTYTCTISTKNNTHFQYCGNNTDISFSDNKITNGTYSTTQSGITYKNIFTFYTYNSSGVLTDGLLTFSNIYLRVYQ